MNFTEEPEEIAKGAASSVRTGAALQSKLGLTSEPDDFEVRWDEHKWALEILNQDCVKASRAKLDERVSGFLALATVEEKDELSRSRDEFQRLVTVAIEASKQCNPDATVASPSVAERLRRGWSSTNKVAYEYIKLLDIMVGQAPEYVGLAYGAVKILLVAQVNNEEVKEKVKGYLEQIQLNFEIIDHLTAYMPSSRLLSLVAEVYCLFNNFIAKAIKHYTQNRFKRYLVAFTMPWKRFQEIVDSIESRLLTIRDVARCVGLVEGRTTMMISQQTLALLQLNMERNQETREMVESIRVQLDVLSLNFSEGDDVRQTADSLAKLAEDRLNEATAANGNNSAVPMSRIASNSLSTDGFQDFDSWQNALFPELQECSEKTAPQQRANEEISNMPGSRSKRESFARSEMAIAWAESHMSEILWINGNEALSREDFNGSFVRPLMLVGESHYDTFIRLQHFCEHTSSDADPYMVMGQDLVSQVLRQHTSISPEQRMAITRERTSTTQGLWELFLELIAGIEVPCVFLIIGGIDHMVARSSQPEQMRAELVDRFRTLTNDARHMFKIMVAIGFFQSPKPSVENLSSVVSACRHRNQYRRLSLDGLKSAFGPSTSQSLAEIQERRCRNIAFTEIPLLYPPDSIVYTQDNGKLMAFVVSELSGMEPRSFGSFTPLRLRVWSVDHDSRQVCKRYHEIAIDYFPGRRDISDLACIPSGYLPEEVTKRRHIIARGQKYWSYMSGVHYVEIRTSRGNKQGIIDQTARNILGFPSLLEGLEPLPISQEGPVKSRFLMVAPPEIYVFCTRAVAWVRVDLEDLVPLEFPTNALGRLILPYEKKKLLVRAIQAFYSKTESQQALPAASKMNPPSEITDRLFFLFHGAPGTGKSHAAQCLANYARRPLFVVTSVTSGMRTDRGTYYGFVSGVFELATRWGCFVLMDHVDVFLEKQSRAGLQMSAIAIEVLDLVDNYQGVLITTSERVNAVDHGLLSRADLPFEFVLNREIRRQIWIDGIRRSGVSEVHTQAIVAKIFEIADHPLNGHAITSIIRSAARIARNEGRFIGFVDVQAHIEAYCDALAQTHSESTMEATNRAQKNGG